MLLTRHRTPEGELELGDLITAAIGLDRSWVRNALCLEWTIDRKPTPWQVDKTQTIDGVRGAEMIKMALMACSACPSQYACARYAVVGQMRAGTWAMGIANLTWLQKKCDTDVALALLDEAERKRAVVHVHVTKARRSISIEA